MLPEHGCAGDRETTLALALLELAGDASVRVIEALAATMINCLRDHPDDILQDWSVPSSPSGGLCENGGTVDDFERRLGLCRRVARRALRGSLADPTRGANAFHRIEASPAWARGQLPVAMYGSYLFYRR